MKLLKIFAMFFGISLLLIGCRPERPEIPTVSIQELASGAIEFGTTVQTAGTLSNSEETISLSEIRMKSGICVGTGNPNCGNMTLESVSITYHVYSLSHNGYKVTIISTNSDLETGWISNIEGNWTENGLKVSK